MSENAEVVGYCMLTYTVGYYCNMGVIDLIPQVFVQVLILS